MNAGQRTSKSPGSQRLFTKHLTTTLETVKLNDNQKTNSKAWIWSSRKQVTIILFDGLHRISLCMGDALNPKQSLLKLSRLFEQFLPNIRQQKVIRLSQFLQVLYKQISRLGSLHESFLIHVVEHFYLFFQIGARTIPAHVHTLSRDGGRLFLKFAAHSGCHRKARRIAMIRVGVWRQALAVGDGFARFFYPHLPVFGERAKTQATRGGTWFKMLAVLTKDLAGFAEFFFGQK
ncbi:hypothetical protein [Acidithiobacillus thiooxidans]|uniref:hypothetical protein n=1 Tax=Acidithiobacillus thiooxidans TaxID=930 RepID=UPI0015943338|nr:hypothetical protein [Acidithiobacillus thiooxidans]